MIAEKSSGKDKKVLLTVKVQPRARKPEVEQLSSGEFRVKVLSPPEKGVANAEVLAALSSYLKISKSQLRIVRGARSRLKVIEIRGDVSNLKNS